MRRQIIILGGGGHAKVVIESLLLQGGRILGYVDLEQDAGPVLGVARLGSEEMIYRYAPGTLHLANGIGFVQRRPLRTKIYERFATQGFAFEQVVHPSAVVASDVKLEDGVQIMASAVVQPGTRIGTNTVINTAASVDHDCNVGSHVHVAPGVVLCGHVRVGDGAHIGAGATISHGKSIGAGSIIGAGAVVLEDVPPFVTAVGVPTRVIERRVCPN